MSVIRRGKFMIDEIGKHYTSIANAVFRDPELSGDEKAVFGLISTHQDGYNITAESLCAKFNPDGQGMKEGLSTVKKALRGLERQGYLSRVRTRTPDGRLDGTHYEVTDMPNGFEISAPVPYPDALPPGGEDDEPGVETPAVEMQPQVQEGRFSRSEPKVETQPVVLPPVVEPPAVSQPVYKKNSFKNNNKNSSSTPNGVEEEPGARDAHAPARTREAEISQPAIDLVDDDDYKIDRKSQMDPTGPKTDKQRRNAEANALGQRFVEYCDDTTTPFPRSEPGTKFTKFAEFTGMLSKVMLNYPDTTEIWAALVLIHARHIAFPSRRELEQQLARSRDTTAQGPAPARPGAAVATTGAVGSGLATTVSPEVATVVDAAMHWWLDEEKTFVPESMIPELRTLFTDAVQKNITPQEITQVMRRCAARGRVVPPDWMFANELLMLRSAATGTQLTVVNGGVVAPAGKKLSVTEERVAKAMILAERYRQEEEAEEAAEAARRNGGVA